MTATILNSKVFTLAEFAVLAKTRDLAQFLDNRVYFTVNDHTKQHELWDSIISWIETSIEGKVIIEKADTPEGMSAVYNFISYYLYFELDTDLAMFAMRWQGKDE